jgi:hypothetical protein
MFMYCLCIVYVNVYVNVYVLFMYCLCKCLCIVYVNVYVNVYVISVFPELEGLFSVAVAIRDVCSSPFAHAGLMSGLTVVFLFAVVIRNLCDTPRACKWKC